jgi:hypothetical protein
MPTMAKKLPMYRAGWSAAVVALAALAAPSGALAVDDVYCVQVPPGATLQVRMHSFDPNDPTPIIVDQIGPDVGGVGISLLGAPESGGTAVVDGGTAVIRTVSPLDAPEQPSDPTLAVSISVPTEAPAAAVVNVTSAAPSPLSLSGPDGQSTACSEPVEQSGGTPPPAVTITDVTPGGGLLPAGSLITVVGTGFDPQALVEIEGVTLASTSWVDSSHIEVVTAVDAQLDARTVTVTNPDLSGATNYALLRSTDLGKSAIPLLADTEAIFPLQTRSSAVFAAPSGGTFFALALQNPTQEEAAVSVELWDAETGSAVASATVALPSLTRISREVSELFPGFVGGPASVLAVTATVPVQMLGLSGNEADRWIVAVLPALASP